MGSPQIAVAVEGDAVDEAASVRRPEGFARRDFAPVVDAQPRDAAAGRLDHVEPFLRGIEADFVGEAEAVGDHAQAAFVEHGDIAVGEVRADRLHPVDDAGRDRQPHPSLAVAQHEVDLADGLAVERVRQHGCLAVPGHPLQPVGAEIGDE